jgi:hypothetical protein
MKRKHFISITVFIIGIILFGLGSSGYAGTLTWATPEQDTIYTGQYYSLELTNAQYSYAGTPVTFYATVTPLVQGTVTTNVAYSWTFAGYPAGSASSLTVNPPAGQYSITCSVVCSGIVYTMPIEESLSGLTSIGVLVIPTPTPQVTLTIQTVGGYGTTNPSAGSYTIPQGSPVTLSASPLSGYVFKQWQTGSAAFVSYSPTISVTVSQSITYVAVFEVASSPTPTPTTMPTPTPTPVPTPTQTPTPTPTPTPQVTLNIGKSGSGAITPVAGTYTYNIHSSVTIYATAASGYQFDYWLFDDYSKSYSSTTTLSMSRSRTALAVFSAIAPSPTPTTQPTSTPAPTPTPTPQVALTMGLSGSGSITPLAGDHNYDVGTVVTISSVPASGYQFEYWLFQDYTKNYSPTTSITMSTSKSALAVFSVIPTSTASPSASPTPAPTPLATATPAPTTQPTPTASSPSEPTPIPLETPIEPFVPEYINANELAMVSGLSAMAIAVIIEVVFFLMRNKR